MATAPVKSPLHNFPLPFLKWGGGKNHTSSNPRYRRPISADSSPVKDQCELDGDRNESEPEAARSHRVGSRTSRNRFGFGTTYEKSQKQQERSERESNEQETEEGEGEETAQKPWNLRPRKGLFSKGSIGFKNGEFQEPEGGDSGCGQHQNENQNQGPKSLRLRGLTPDQQSSEKKEKRRLWIALSREEIEEDIFVMTGSRPARRPRKRPKNVQKQLDSCFPGLWLVGASADSYRIADAAAKR
ncbi:hypothetical protein UlMin_001597 [Ulmus minor]